MSEKTIRFLIVSVVLSWSSSALTQHLDPAMRQFVSVDEKVIVLSHVRVIDGTGVPPRDDQTIAVRDGNIESIHIPTLCRCRWGEGPTSFYMG
jgi:hypothetical protein